MADTTLFPEALRDLTPKQRETIDLLADGYTSKEIAYELDISESAAIQRIETLRSKAGGVLRKDLARMWRDLRTSQATCKDLTGNKNHLPEQTLNFDRRPQNDPPSESLLADALTFQMSAPWSGQTEPRVVPEVLDGEKSSVARLALAVALALGLAVMMLVLLAVASEIGNLT